MQKSGKCELLLGEKIIVETHLEMTDMIEIADKVIKNYKYASLFKKVQEKTSMMRQGMEDIKISEWNF